ncbi:MAG: hypothetical protein ACT4QE_04940 [Anaerolineales bacterium]
MKLELAPTLHLQRELFAQPRTMERFYNYLATLTGGGDDIVTPIISMNPMGREHNLAKIDELLAINAEEVATEALAEANERLAHIELVRRLSLVITDNLGGLWSNRHLIEFSACCPQKIPKKTVIVRGFYEVNLLVSETWTPGAIRQTVLRVAYRLAHMQVYGLPKTIEEAMRQEGRALRFAGVTPAFAPDELDYSRHVLSPYRAATSMPVMMAALFGDEAAHALGYEPFGLSSRAGLEVALAEALADPVTAEAALAIRKRDCDG